MAAKNEQLKALHDKIKGGKPLFVEQARSFVAQWLLANVGILEDMNRQQLAKGIYTDEQTIQDGYSDLWQLERVRKGKQVAFVDLNFTGEFYESITAEPTLNFVQFDTTDDKYARLNKLFPGGILGLTQENATQVGFLAAAGIRDNLMNYLTR